MFFGEERSFSFVFLAAPRGMWDLSSPTKGPGIEPMSPAVEVWSLNHWTAREVPKRCIFKE